MRNCHRMFLKPLFILLLFIYFLVIPNLSFAANVILFQETFTRGRGKPQTEQRNFTAIAGQGFLIIHNGDVNGENRISSAKIVLNGSQIVRPNEFNQQVESIEKPVVLSQNNTLQVQLNSAPGSFINIQVDVLEGVVLSVPPGFQLDTQLITLNGPVSLNNVNHLEHSKQS